MNYFCYMQHKIVLIGGPGTGKTSVLNQLISQNFCCMPEISREVILNAQKEGIEQLFLKKPLLFSQLLLKGRVQQYLNAMAINTNLVFFDRGIPDVFAYMDYFKTDYPKTFTEKSKEYKYTKVFHFAPWKEIYTRDNERYESFEESQLIDGYLLKAYASLGYKIQSVPFGTVKERTNFILQAIS